MLGSEGLEAMPKGRGEQIQVQVSEAGDQFRFLQQQEKGKSWGKLGGSMPSQSGSRQQAGRQGWGLGQQVKDQSMGTQGNKLMPRKQGPHKASLLGQCSSP